MVLRQPDAQFVVDEGQPVAFRALRGPGRKTDIDGAFLEQAREVDVRVFFEADADLRVVRQEGFQDGRQDESRDAPVAADGEDAAQRKRLEEKVELGFWENLEKGLTVLRIATSWATTDKAVDQLIEIL